MKGSIHAHFKPYIYPIRLLYASVQTDKYLAAIRQFIPALPSEFIQSRWPRFGVHSKTSCQTATRLYHNRLIGHEKIDTRSLFPHSIGSKGICLNGICTIQPSRRKINSVFPDTGVLKVGTHSELNALLDEFVKSVQAVLIDKSEHIFYNSMVHKSMRRRSKAFSTPLFRS